MEDEGRITKLWWAVPASALLLLMALAMLLGEPERREHGTSYDASSRGFRAAYLLLEEMGYPVTRSRRLTGPGIRWVLFPKKTTAKETAQLADRVREGGLLLLADADEEFGSQMGIRLKFETLEPSQVEETASGLGVHRLASGNVKAAWPGQKGTVLVWAGAEPVVTIYPWARGQIWLVERPELVSNQQLRKADNGLLLCRLAEAMLKDRPGQIAFDEYFHGMRDRPGVTELLLRPPASWATVHGLVLLGVLLWHFVPRFGAVQAPERAARRSQEEFLDAVASLLERKRDYQAAYASVRTAFTRELQEDLGLPAETPPEEIVQEAARRRPIDQARFRRVLAGAPATGANLFLNAMNELETARDEFFHPRNPR